MPGDMSVFDVEEHIDFQDYKASGRKMPKMKRTPAKTPMSSTKGKRIDQDSLGKDDRAPDEDGFYAEDAQHEVRPGSGKGTND